MNIKMTPLRSILQYYPDIESTDKKKILREIARTLVEVTGRWTILCADFKDNSQAGHLRYSFGDDFSDSGLFVEEILSVTVNGICYTEVANANCRDVDYGYVVSEDKLTITLTTSPHCDVRDGVVVKAKLGVDLLDVCQLPTYFFRKFAVHIVNYTVYKQEALRRKEKTPSSRAYFAQLRDDAEDYFNKNQCPKVFREQAVIIDSDPIGFSSC